MRGAFIRVLPTDSVLQVRQLMQLASGLAGAVAGMAASVPLPCVKMPIEVISS
jgi:hypothetical protein